MIKLLKTCKEFYFFGYNAKISVFYTILFLVAGFLLSYAGTVGVFFLMTSAIWLVQTFLTLPVVDVVKSSPKRKLFETTLPALVGLVGTVAVYIMFAVVVWLRNRNGHLQEEQMTSLMIQAGYYALITLMYCGVAYKFMVVSTIVYYILAMFVLNGFLYGYLAGLFVGVPFEVGILIGLVSILVGAALQWLLARLFYKYPMTRHAQSRHLSKLMH